MQSVVTITGHSTKSGQGKRGPWTLHIFETASGGTFQTFDQGVANAAYALIGQAASVEYDAEQKGDYVNNVLRSIAASSSPATQAPVRVPAGDKDRLIVAQTVIKALPEHVAAGLIPAPSSPSRESWTRLAEFVANWVIEFGNGAASGGAEAGAQAQNEGRALGGGGEAPGGTGQPDPQAQPDDDFPF